MVSFHDHSKTWKGKELKEKGKEKSKELKEKGIEKTREYKERAKRENWYTIPNAISASRLISISLH